jgi:predicted nucleic acid-binding protein
MKKVFFDSNVFINILEYGINLLDPFLVMVRKDNPDLKKVLVSDLVLLETYSFLNNKLGFDRAISFSEWIRNDEFFEIVNYNPSNLTKALELAQKYTNPVTKKAISLVDAFLLLEAEEYNTVIYTSDVLMTIWINKHKRPSAILFK